jgi:type IV pilus assembly protein PilE
MLTARWGRNEVTAGVLLSQEISVQLTHRLRKKWALRSFAEGFTLIELVIVVTIVSILALIAYPSYVDQLQKGRRSAAQSWLMELASKEQQLYTDVRSYTTDLSSWPPPSEAALYYGFTASASVGPPASFTLTATPVAGTSQVSDGILTLASDGTKSPANKW